MPRRRKTGEKSSSVTLAPTHASPPRAFSSTPCLAIALRKRGCTKFVGRLWWNLSCKDTTEPYLRTVRYILRCCLLTLLRIFWVGGFEMRPAVTRIQTHLKGRVAYMFNVLTSSVAMYVWYPLACIVVALWSIHTPRRVRSSSAVPGTCKAGCAAATAFLLWKPSYCLQQVPGYVVHSEPNSIVPGTDVLWHTYSSALFTWYTKMHVFTVRKGVPGTISKKRLQPWLSATTMSQNIRTVWIKY